MRERVRHIVIIVAQVLACASVALCAIYMFRWGEFASVCLESHLVDRFVLFSEGVEISRCGNGYSTVMGFSRIPTPIPVTRSLTPLDGLLSEWPAPSQPISVVVSELEQMSYFGDPQVAVLGAVPARESSNLQSAILLSWMKQIAPQADEFSRRVLIEFLRSVANKKFRIESLDGSFPALSQVRYGDLPTLAADYCQSPWRALDELNTCDSTGVSAWRPILANALWLIYDDLSWRERRSFWAWLRSTVLEQDQFIPNEILIGDSREIPRVVHHWLEHSVSAERRESIFARVSQKLNLNAISTPLVGVMGDVRAEMAQIHRPVLAFISGGWRWISPFGQFKSELSKPQVRHLIVFGCRPSPNREALRAAKVTVLLASKCNHVGPIHMDELESGDMAGFISANLELGIIWLNASVLRAKMKKVLPDAMFSQRLTLKRLRRIEPWREDRWDEALRAFRPHSQSVDLVLSHRASRDLL